LSRFIRFHQEAIMDVFIGFDVSLSKTAVCVVDRDGTVLWQGKVPSEPGPLIARLAEWSGSIDLAGIEACPLSEWLHRGCARPAIYRMYRGAPRSALPVYPIRRSGRNQGRDRAPLVAADVARHFVAGGALSADAEGADCHITLGEASDGRERTG
jgi:hypothetical protein